MRPFTRSTLLTLLCVALAGGMAGRQAPDAAGLMALSARPGVPVIARVWHGRTVRAKADAYEEFLTNMEPLVRNYELRVNAIRP